MSQAKRQKDKLDPALYVITLSATRNAAVRYHLAIKCNKAQRQAELHQLS